jgi:hypothetical protein
MKILFNLILLAFTAGICNIQQVRAAESEYILDFTYQTAGIDSLDTIYFDLRSAQLTGGAVEFPVYFKANDSVYAMDFSFKYNQSNLIYDTITGLQSYVSFLSNYSSFDSTVYFTSYSIGNAYQNNTNLVEAKFFLLGGQSAILVQDLNAALGYLNGDACSVKIIPPSLTGIGEIPASVYSLYPNPATDVIKLDMSEEAMAYITDINGRMIQMPFSCLPGVSTSIQVGNLTDGIYFLYLQTPDGRAAQARFMVKK